MFLLVLLGALAGGLGVLSHASLSVRREKSPLHRVLAELADTDRRPPGALFARDVKAIDGDFGAGVANHCGCALPVRGTRRAGGSFPDTTFTTPPVIACSTGGCS